MVRDRAPRRGAGRGPGIRLAGQMSVQNAPGAERACLPDIQNVARCDTSTRTSSSIRSARSNRRELMEAHRAPSHLRPRCLCLMGERRPGLTRTAVCSER